MDLLNRILLFCGVTTMFAACAPTPSIVAPQGFTDAYFDETTLTPIVANGSCTKVRFYNARRKADDAVGTALAIGINASGVELYTELGSRYQLFTSLSGARALTNQLTRTAAITAVKYVSTAKDSSYVAEFTKADVMAMLVATDCNGVKVSASKLPSGYYTMKLAAVKIANGQATELGNVTPKLCIDPCPVVCGPPGNYLIQR